MNSPQRFGVFSVCTHDAPSKMDTTEVRFYWKTWRDECFQTSKLERFFRVMVMGGNIVLSVYLFAESIQASCCGTTDKRGRSTRPTGLRRD